MPFTLFAGTRRAPALDSLAGTVDDGAPGRAGGVVAAYTGIGGIPGDRLANREPLPAWPAAGSGE